MAPEQNRPAVYANVSRTSYERADCAGEQMMKNDKRGAKPGYILLGLGIALVVCMVCAIMLGRYPISLREVGGIFLSKFHLVEPFWTVQTERVLLNIRLPRVLLSCLVGCGLATAGTAYQGIFQNPMASPDTLGASAGAAFGAALAILCSASTLWIGICAFLCSMLCVALVWLIGRRAKVHQLLALVLSGVMVGALFQAGTSLIKLVADPNNQLPAITYWLMGSLAGASMRDVLFALAPMVCGLLPLWLLRWRVNLLTLGEEEAKTMGTRIGALRLAVILCATLITAASVAVGGTIGWIGLVIPHLARRMIGNDNRYLLPGSMLLGSIFLLAVDTVARNLLATEIPLGILTAFLGAPFLLHMIMKGDRVY